LNDSAHEPVCGAYPNFTEPKPRAFGGGEKPQPTSEQTSRRDRRGAERKNNLMDEKPHSKAPYQPPDPAKTPPAVPGVDPRKLRQNLEKDTVELEKLTQRNAASNDWVTKGEKAQSDVSKALDEYKKVVDGFQSKKRDADHTSQRDMQDAKAEIGANQAKVDQGIKDVSQPIEVLQKQVSDLPEQKRDSETEFSDAQKALDHAQTVLQAALAYQADLAARLKAVTDAQSKAQKANDHTHSAEFYFYANEVANLLKEGVNTPDELNADLSEKLGALQVALDNVIQAKVKLIGVTVDLDVAQKQLADLQKNRETQILANITPLNAPEAKPSETAAGRSAK
jgi:chromosome segregation ATPase